MYYSWQIIILSVAKIIIISPYRDASIQEFHINIINSIQNIKAALNFFSQSADGSK